VRCPNQAKVAAVFKMWDGEVRAQIMCDRHAKQSDESCGSNAPIVFGRLIDPAGARYSAPRPEKPTILRRRMERSEDRDD